MQEKKRKRKYFLFNDMFLLVTVQPKKRTKKHELKSRIDLLKVNSKVRVDDMKDDQEFLGTKSKNSFLLHSIDESLYIFCNTPEEKNKLFTSIQTALLSKKG